MRAPSIRRRAPGFGLAEAMVAITILAFIGAATYGVFAGAMAARDKAELVTSHYHEIRQSMLRMAREVSMAFLSHHKDCSDLRNDSVFVVSRTGGGMRLDFTAFAHTKTRKDANESDQSELSFFLAADPDHANESALFRREQARVDEEPAEGGREDVLAHRVSELKFEFYDAKEDRWDDDWDTGNAEYRNRLPAFVRIELKAKHPLSGAEEVFVTKTRVYVQRVIHVWGTNFMRPAEGC